MGKILLVEDDFYVRKLYLAAFKKKGHEVVEAEDGQKALDLIGDESYQFIVLDLMLPGVSGIEILKKVKSSRQIPVFILTNVGDEAVLSEAVASGADAYFLKVDYTPNRLVETIESKLAAAPKPEGSSE